jgi:type I restriction enzyme, S subunit
MTAQNKNVPALRFPEFNGDWEVTKLGKYLTFKNGINADKSQYGQGKKFINVLDIINNNGILHDNIIGKVSVSENELKKNEVKYGDILFQRSSETREEVGQSNVYLDKFQTATFGGFVIRGQAIQEYNPLFFHYLLKTASAREEITTKSGGSTRYNIGQEILKVVNITIPTFPEQQKIAAFITAVDEKIHQLATKKDLLEQYKKGVMQKIFNQQIRFKDDNGNDYADWEEKKGNEIFESVSNKTHNSDLPILAITQEFGAIPRNLIDYQISVTDKSVESYKVVDVGDFIISLRSFQGGIEYSNYKGICSPAYIILRSKVGINNLFYKYYLKTDSYIQKMNAKLEGIRDGKMVSYKYFSEISLPLPSIEEQNKIATFFAVIDNKINSVNQQLEKTRSYKKGLLQQMFV